MISYEIVYPNDRHATLFRNNILAYQATGVERKKLVNQVVAIYIFRIPGLELSCWKMSIINSVVLSNGVGIPQFGLGLYKMTKNELVQVLGAFKETKCYPIHVDGATVYENQVEFAETVKELDIPRQNLFITDKLWDTEHGDVEGACRKALKRLNTNYLDLYLIHWPFSLVPNENDPLTAKRDAQGNPIKFDITLNAVWSQMEHLVEKGLVRCIGLSNFTQNDINEILKTAIIRPAILQIESHPWLPQQDLIDYCASLGIKVEAYSPLGTSLLLHDAVVKDVAVESNVTPAQVLIAFARQRGLIALCKTGNPTRLIENLTPVNLSPQQMSRLHTLSNGKRIFHPSDWYGSMYNNWPNV